MEHIPNPDLQLAFDFVSFTNRNIFLTGKAGTGKTTFLHELKKNLPKRMVVLAPTGIAAINAGGVTIHSFFQLPFHPFVPAHYLPGRDPSNKKDHNGYKMSREKINIIKSLDLLVIDEISMVRADVLDAVDSALRRYKNHALPFGGVQLLMIGDLQQLAPVSKEEDNEILGKYYNSLFFFGSLALKSTDYVTIELKHIYRQNDKAFIDLLNKVRENKLDTDAINELNKRHIPGFSPSDDDDFITLTTHNHQARTINDSKLAKLPGKEHVFRAAVRDDFPELAYPNVSELVLKKDAQVMFVKNDISQEKLYFNGKIGRVEGFEEDIIVVKCPGDDYPIRVEVAEWQNMKYSLNEETKDIEETVIGTFIQYPLKPAWAITIHKSQGLTFDRAVIDARAAFAHGQVYVALSRCRTLDGLVLSTPIDRRCIIENASVTGFIKETEKNQPGQKELEESKKAYREMILTELFDFLPLTFQLANCIKVTEDHKQIIQGDPREKLENALMCIRKDLVEISQKFQTQRNRIYATGNEELPEERIRKAAEYFAGKLESVSNAILPDFSIETDNKTVRKAFKEPYDRLRKESITKLACLNKMKSGFSVSGYLEIKAKAAIENLPAGTHAPVSDSSSSTILHPALYNELKKWRKEKAAMLKLPEYMILPQKTMTALSGTLPQSMSSLKHVKGMGKKKSQKFGEELLNIIKAYCNKENIGIPAEPSEDEEKPKKVKKDTKKETYNMFKEGKTLQQIAEERGYAPATIESHLAYFVSTGEIQLSELLSQEKIELILPIFEGNDELRLGPVKEKLGENVTWSELRFVANHIRFLNERKSGITQKA
ncbi:MAG TPA: helix-turn-helix domain-containing protein [Bacteroidales bacterium]|nr:helix-turn-helix domain-containing protein [Bacteroidales bacterium]